MSAAAMANCAAGRSGVGPGVNKRVLRIMALSWISDGACRGSWKQSKVGQVLRNTGAAQPPHGHPSITEYTQMWFIWKLFSVQISSLRSKSTQIHLYLPKIGTILLWGWN